MADTLQVPELNYEHDFQGTAAPEDGRDRRGEVDDEEPTPTKGWGRKRLRQLPFGAKKYTKTSE